MLRRTRSRLTFANITAMVALFIALGGSAYAAATIGSRDIKNNAVKSRHVKNGQIRPVDLSANARARDVLTATVSANGTLANASLPGTTSTKINPGNYRVDFGRNVSNCTYAGTQKEFDATNLGTIGAEPDATDANRVAVRTTNAANGTADRDFYLTVVC